MKIYFFNKVLFQGTPEECECFKNNFLDTLEKLDNEMKDTYPMKQTDTYETYFEALKILNPFVYDTLCYIKEGVGEYFLEMDGANRARTYDPLLVRQMLSQLSYDPIFYF